MGESERASSGVVNDIGQHLESVFRHMLPGALVIGIIWIANPDWFKWVDLKSWQHLTVLLVVSIVAGNAWFALNRYGLHQFIDYMFYLSGWKSPALETGQSAQYIDELGKYACSSLHATTNRLRARRHVAFRASAVLLILTLGELGVITGFWHAPNSIISEHPILFVILGFLTFAAGVWQMGITRRIDHYVVSFGKDLSNQKA